MGNEDQPTKITTETDSKSTTVETPKPPEPDITTVETETTTVESKPAS